jgi:two-component system, LytTR family, response regulator AlgR
MNPRPLRVLVVDDEPLARGRLTSLVDECAAPRCEVVHACADADEAQRVLMTQRVDCILLDIQMPDVDGLEFARRLRNAAAPSDAPPAVIFVTAHSQHALEAFELEAVDYLTKPVRRERLQAALERVARQRPTSSAAVAESPVLVATERGRVARIPLDEVLYLKAELKYVTLRTAERSWVLDESLTELEQRLGDGLPVAPGRPKPPTAPSGGSERSDLAGTRFIRIHRNALVARNAVMALDRHGAPDTEDGEPVWSVHIRHVGEWLPVSRRQLSAVREALQQQR